MKTKSTKKVPDGKSSKSKSSKKLDAVIQEVISSDLTERQKLFVILYTTDAQCFGNASRSYVVAYDLKTDRQKKLARANAWYLLTNPIIIEFRNSLLKATYESVDRALHETIFQRKDLHARMSGIKEFNKLKNRVKEAPPSVGPITIKIAPELLEKNGL